MFIALIIDSSQKAEIIQTWINRWMDEQNVIYTCNGILLSIKGMEFWYMPYHGQTLEIVPRWKEPDAKGQILYDSTDKIYLKQANS